MTSLGDILLFKTRYGLWRSDGTEKGTVQITEDLIILSDSPDQPFVTIGETAFFDAYDEQGGTELWKSDGTAEGTMRVADLAPGTDSSLPQNLMATLESLYFTTSPEPNETWLWQSDGTAEGTVSVASLSGDTMAPKLHQFTDLADRLYFLVDEALWMYKDGTAGRVAQTTELKVLHLTRVRDKLVLVVDAGENGQGVWVFAPDTLQPQD